tara:strand:- start:44 stop:373 length:330 start_codon:yes stop_codon:yes gene_type:complete
MDMKTYYKMLNADGDELGRWVGDAEDNQHRLGEVINETVVTTILDDTPTPDLETPVRQERNELLAASDWTQVADAPVDQAAWAAYRQELRDVTSQETFPSEVTWPVPPQ